MEINPVLQQIADALDIPYEQVVADLEAVNFSLNSILDADIIE